MKDDLISRQAAIEAFYQYPNINWTTLDVMEKIDKVPSAQSEIIRCKDCKYNLNNARRYDDPDQILTYAWCNTEAFQENDFCSKGKRKEE